MTECVLQINKRAKRPEDHLAFAAAEPLEPPIDIGGGMCYYRFIEHFEKLPSEEDRKTGLTNIDSTDETEENIYFTIDQSRLPIVKETALSVAGEFPGDYSRQYEEFLHRLQDQQVISE
ncbi:hypothetical protein [Domibacillus indicus]|uniref:hypothetical protein n=1 Tax=Domibacillus indicus TaxID=1437523 RepID=UPI000617D6F8|nr:hypothetical protein [Domibacillus indicus]